MDQLNDPEDYPCLLASLAQDPAYVLVHDEKCNRM